MEEFVESFDTIKFKMNTHQNNVVSLNKRVDDSSTKLLEVDNSLKELDEVKNILTILKNYKMESKKEFILNTINTALFDVFNQSLRIDIEATSSTSTGKINMKYDIVLYQNEIEMARNEKLLGNNGGGVLSFVSILFKVLVGYIYSDNKFFLFDESISQVSPLYRPRLAQFLNKFCNQYNFTIVLISQTDDIDEYANLGYILEGELDKDGVPELKIQKIFGEYPEDKYTYVKIENFQSIVKQEFRYKGFTVIRGNNNIGKSASFRAINSLLFNTFDSNDHPRKKRARGSDTKILFGFYDTESTEDKKISLVYKSNKVIYEFNDKTFAGKALAFEKVKEKVESIGFKYVDLKETYKNFKGNLKDQTERLALTTQYDGFFLVGNKSSETEKVFNFLFDSTDVANAIASVSLDILSLTNEYNVLTNNIKIWKKDIEKETILQDIYIRKFYNRMINDYLIMNGSYQKSYNIKLAYEEILNFINFLITIEKGLENLNIKINQLNDYKNNNSNKLLNIIVEIINLLETNNKMEKFIEQSEQHNILLSSIQSSKDKLIIIENIIKNLSETDAYRYYTKLFNTYFENLSILSKLQMNNESLRSNIINTIISELLIVNTLDKDLEIYISKFNENIKLQNTFENTKKELESLSDTYGIALCDCCSGTGYKITH